MGNQITARFPLVLTIRTTLVVYFLVSLLQIVAAGDDHTASSILVNFNIVWNLIAVLLVTYLPSIEQPTQPPQVDHTEESGTTDPAPHATDGNETRPRNIAPLKKARRFALILFFPIMDFALATADLVVALKFVHHDYLISYGYIDKYPDLSLRLVPLCALEYTLVVMQSIGLCAGWMKKRKQG
ncbi:hypothetical protein TruAng_000503 [Truncatella angustata]|nr:hypothetical protein TruAng_000503 [Truncatella angustata]